MEIEKELESERWGCASTRTVDSRRQLVPVLELNINAQRMSFLTSIVLSLGHLGPRLLGLAAQSLIKSPGEGWQSD